MGTISSGVGLISGLDYGALIDKLLAIDARPRDQLATRISTLDAQRTAFVDVSARLSAIVSRLVALKSDSLFRSSRVSSSNADVLSATAGAGAAPGAYSFVVKALAASHQVISRGFSSADAALSSGVLTIESARARVDRRTRLDELNGFAGVRRGSIRLTDGSNASATINLSDAETLDDVVARINAAGLKIAATVRDDRIVLRETTRGAIRVQEVEGGRTAADLGFGPGNVSGTGELTGAALVYLSGGVALDALNDGNGVRTARAGGDFSINGDVVVDLSGILKTSTRLQRLNHGAGVRLGRVRITTADSTGQQVREVDLSQARTINDVKTAIEQAAGGVTVSVTGSRLIVGYGDNRTQPLKIEDLSGNAAKDLGILGSSESGKITGRDVLKIDRLQDVLSAINFADANSGSVTASIEGDHIRISTSSGDLRLAAVGGSKALADLGFVEGAFTGAVDGARVINGVDSVLLRTLNGGHGVQAGTILIQAHGTSAEVDLSGKHSLKQVIDAINDASQAAGLNVEAGYDRTGARLSIASLDGVAPVTVSDASGNFAAVTGLDQAVGPELTSANLQRRYLGENTLLSTLNGGRGVRGGSLRITDSTGTAATVDLSGSTVRTLGDAIDRINAAGTGVRARLNDTGDGLLLEDSTNGSATAKVEESGGTTAKELNLLGELRGGRLDGSFELRLDVSAGQSLADLAASINARTPLASASVINNGTGVNPYRLSLNATAQGLAGELLIDGGATGLDFTTLTRAADAKVVFGSDAAGGVLITSSTNTITTAVPGLTLNLNSVSDRPVTVTVEKTIGGVVDAMNGLVTAFNAALDRISELGDFNSETKRKGVLLGDSALQSIENRLYRLVNQFVPGAPGGLQQLQQVGLSLRDGRLAFDETRFKNELERNPDAVVEFFTDETRGVATWLKGQVEQLTQSGGLIKRRDESLQKQRTQLSGRIDNLNELLERKRIRMTNQFIAMERALSLIQGQQGALSQLSSLAGSFSAAAAQR